MTDRELMQKALEKLEFFSHMKSVSEDTTKLITALRERLSQPVQEPQLVAVIGNWGRVEWVDGVFPQLGDKMYSAPRPATGCTSRS